MLGGSLLLGLLALTWPARAEPATVPAGAIAAPGTVDDEPTVAELKAALAELRRRLEQQRAGGAAAPTDRDLLAARQQIDRLMRTLGDLRRERDSLRRELLQARAAQAEAQGVAAASAQRLRRAEAALVELQQSMASRNEQDAALRREIARLSASAAPPAPARLASQEPWSGRLDGAAFVPGSAVLQPAALPQLAAMLATLDAEPHTRVRIVGHTDSSGDAQANQTLSLRRAEAVRDQLVATFGLDPARFEVIGMGEAEPLVSNDTPEGRRANRRVELSLEPEGAGSAQ